MDNIWNEYFLLSYLKESNLERTNSIFASILPHMIINGNEIRWPRHKNFMAALEDRTAEVFRPGGTWETLSPA